MVEHGDLNNSHAAREKVELAVDPTYHGKSFAIAEAADDATVRELYRPFLLPPSAAANDWVAELELSTVLKFVESESYSRLLAYEAARILFRLGCDVRVYDPTGLPQKDDINHTHPKVQELRELSKWSDGHVWVSHEQHGNLTGIFKQQIDWIPLATGSVRPTQGRTLAVAQVSGGSQSFNSVNSLRILGRWMRMLVIANQSSVPKAYTQFSSKEEGSRMLPSGNRDRLVDCMEELVKYTIIMRPHFDLFGDRFSEREEARLKKM
ncbi:hypothetical protein NQ176_g3644 [Zarea fungicola]|uniref:Uncharacterized protein n=1 Tax=Zarea fungicola TaxID=93591 RepID=A0ACC1NII9_9HYPO|nr:hypothetical protein NQ176_g3644 [Lecanicillium fungicola]